MTKDNLRKLLKECKTISEDFGLEDELRPAYAIDITDAGGVQWMIPEQWFFRYLVAFEILAEDRGLSVKVLNDILDEKIAKRIEEGCSERYR